jgi:hypothetical protein
VLALPDPEAGKALKFEIVLTIANKYADDCDEMQ